MKVDASPSHIMQVYISRNGEVLGPYTVAQIREMQQAQALLPMELVCFEGANEWTPLYQVRELSAEVPPVRHHVGSSFPLASDAGTGVTDEDIALFVGSRSGYYLANWKRGGWSNRGSRAAIFLGPIWFFYRRMYLYGILSCAVAILVVLVAEAQGYRGSYIPVAILLSILGGALYRSRAVRTITRIKEDQRDRALQQQLIAEAGGTNAYAAVAVAAVVALGMVVSFNSILDEPNDAPASALAQGETRPAGSTGSLESEKHSPLPEDAELIVSATEQRDPRELRIEEALKTEFGMTAIQKLGGMPDQLVGAYEILAIVPEKGEVTLPPNGAKWTVRITKDSLQTPQSTADLVYVVSGDREGAQYVVAETKTGAFYCFSALDGSAEHMGARCFFEAMDKNNSVKILLK